MSDINRMHNVVAGVNGNRKPARPVLASSVMCETLQLFQALAKTLGACGYYPLDKGLFTIAGRILEIGDVLGSSPTRQE